MKEKLILVKTKSVTLSEKNPYPKDYCELIKAKSLNFPGKKQSLPCFSVPGSSHHILGGSTKRERQSKRGESMNV
jgi:hypothetical protein